MSEIAEAHFGKSDLISANTTVDFDSLAHTIETKYQDSAGKYLSDKMIPTIRNYVHNVRRTHDLPLHWENNNCESMNHILKINQN